MPGPDDALPGRDRSPFTVPERHTVLGNPLDPPYPEGIETAYFALGCFWGAERLFWKLEGVYTTAVGYQNGMTPYPTYEEVCSGHTGHAEAVLVAFDPALISYERLLQVFFTEHDPTQGMRQGNDVGTQYRSGIYYTDEGQKETAERVLAGYQAALDERGLANDHDRSRACGAVLLRGGVPPAVPRQGTQWLLRTGRNRSRLPGRHRRGRIVGCLTPGTDRCPADLN